MKFQDKTFEVCLILKWSKHSVNGLFEERQENLHGKGTVLSGMNIIKIVKL